MAVAAIYARYSSAGQREESIEDQVRVCTEAAERAGDNVVRVYQDRASTGTSVDHRHGFLQMVADGQRGAFEVLYVYKTDRFARNRYDSAVYKMRLRRAGVRVVSATERIEDGPDGILLESVLEGMAEYYSANLSENVRRGLDGNAEKCRHNGVRTFGYELGADGYFALDEAEAPVVLGCFEAYADGMGMPEICAEYSWVRTKMGKPLTVSMLSRMLRNEKYRGRYSYGGHVVEGGMPRIVSDELFYAVQRMLAAATRRRRGVMDYLLTGKLFDEEGHRYQSQSGHGKSGRKYTYYKCPATGHAVRQDALEAEVARGVAGILEADDGAVAAIVAMVLAEQDEAAAGDVAAMDAMRSRLAENAREQSRMVDLAAKTGAVDAVAAKMAELSEERGALERDLAEMERACPLLSGEEVEFWVRRVMGRRDPLEAVRLFVSRVVLDRARGEILVEFTFDGGRGGGGGGGGEKPNPRPGDCPGGGSDRLRMAESWGFEPQIGFASYTRLAGEHLRPLGQLSNVMPEHHTAQPRISQLSRKQPPEERVVHDDVCPPRGECLPREARHQLGRPPLPSGPCQAGRAGERAHDALGAHAAGTKGAKVEVLLALCEAPTVGCHEQRDVPVLRGLVSKKPAQVDLPRARA